MKFKLILALSAFVVLFSFFFFSASASNDQNTQEIFENQFNDSGADELQYSLPDKTREYLENAGVSADNTENLSLEGVLRSAVEILGDTSKKPLESGIKILGIIVISAIVGGIKEGIGDDLSKRAVTVVTGAAISLSVAVPVAEVIDNIQNALTASEHFTVAFTPIYAAIVSVSGAPVSAASFSAVTSVICSVVSVMICTVILPVSRMLLGFSVISSCSSNSGINGAAEMVQKYVKWILNVCSVIFMGVLTLKGVVAASSDTVALRTARFVVSNFVPVVGGALSDATTVVYGSLKVLKGTVGAFGIVAFGYIFLPVITELLVWMAVIEFCSFCSKLMGVKNAEGMFSSISSVMGILMSATVFSLFALVISTASAVMCGGGSV